MSAELHQDESTLSYFSEHCPEYDVSRLNVAVDLVTQVADPSCSILEVGCGNGNLLEFFRAQTGYTNLTGLDYNPQALEIARDLTGCSTIEGSILADEVVRGHESAFDVVLVTAVLHHLTGTTRRASMSMARAAVENSLRLVKPGGTLVVVEPTFGPSFLMGGLFHTKRLVSAITDKRVEIGSTWNNIGPPVVSFLTDDQLEDIVSVDGLELSVAHRQDAALTRFMRFAGLRYRHDMTMVLQKAGSVG